MSKHTAKIGSERAAAIYRALRHAIIEQALEPGAKLPEDAIGERFGVSRTLVRHALGQLAAEGLVELRRNRGAAVAKPELGRGARHLRRPARPGAAGRGAARRTAHRPSRPARLEEHVANEEAARGTNEPLSIRLAGEFHTLLAEMTGNALLDALRQRGGVALGPDPGDLRPAAFLRMRGAASIAPSSRRWPATTPSVRPP